MPVCAFYLFGLSTQEAPGFVRGGVSSAVEEDRGEFGRCVFVRGDGNSLPGVVVA